MKFTPRNFKLLLAACERRDWRAVRALVPAPLKRGQHKHPHAWKQRASEGKP